MTSDSKPALFYGMRTDLPDTFYAGQEIWTDISGVDELSLQDEVFDNPLVISDIGHLSLGDGLIVNGDLVISDCYIDRLPEHAIINGTLHLERVNQIAVPNGIIARCGVRITDDPEPELIINGTLHVERVNQIAVSKGITARCGVRITDDPEPEL